jgi:carbon monoxide dehydrogenase subunit G
MSISTRLRGETTVSVDPELVWEYLVNPHSQLEYDRSVAKVEVTSPEPYGVGTTFTTISPTRSDGKTTRTSYRIAEIVERDHARVELVGSRLFQRATWNTTVEPVERGTHIILEVEFVPKPQYFLLAPLLSIAQRNLIATDMQLMHDALEAHAAGLS